MKKNREGSKISCSCGTRRDSLECSKVRKHTKERCQKWKSLSSSGKVSGREREREGKEPHICHGWKKIRRKLNEKVSQVKKFNITFEKVKKEVAKRKGWTAPGIDRTISGKS